LFKIQKECKQIEIEMSIIIILITVSLSVAAAFLIAFLWAVKSDQYEDTFSPAMRILHDNKENKINTEKTEL